MADFSYYVDSAFAHHSPKPGQGDRYTALRAAAKVLALAYLEECPVSRERSLALTNLEQAMFWANAAIARNE